jgi:hypothetical protein
MKGVFGCENQTKLKQLLPEVRSRLFENQGTHFIFHSSFFAVACRRAPGLWGELKIKN